MLLVDAEFRTAGEEPEMKGGRFAEEQIVGVLRENKAGATVAERCRKHGMRSAPLYAWNAKYGGMDVFEAKRLEALNERRRS